MQRFEKRDFLFALEMVNGGECTSMMKLPMNWMTAMKRMVQVYRPSPPATAGLWTHTHQISGTDCADIASLSTNTCLSDAFGDREKNNHSGGYEGVRCSSAELGNNLARYWKKCYFREKSIREIRVVSRFTVLEIANGTGFFPI